MRSEPNDDDDDDDDDNNNERWQDIVLAQLQCNSIVQWQ
jgi:hypothetical protein